MRTEKLVAVEIPNQRYVVRVDQGPRLGTLFSKDSGWCFQFDGTAEESAAFPEPESALGEMQGAAERLGRIRPAA